MYMLTLPDLRNLDDAACGVLSHALMLARLEYCAKVSTMPALPCTKCGVTSIMILT